MSSERASLKAAYCFKPKKIYLLFLLAGGKRNMAAKGILVPFLPWKKYLVVRARKPVQINFYYHSYKQINKFGIKN